MDPERRQWCSQTTLSADDATGSPGDNGSIRQGSGGIEGHGRIYCFAWRRKEEEGKTEGFLKRPQLLLLWYRLPDWATASLLH